MTGLAFMLGVATQLFAANAAMVPDPTAPPSPSASAPSFAVAPGGAGSPLAGLPKGGPPRVVWTGFQVTDGGARVFVQTSGPVQLDLKTVKDGVTVTLHDCRVHMRNNSRTLDTRFFVSPIKQVAVHQRRRDVELAISLKEPAASTPRQEPGPDGTQFWIVDFATISKVASARR